MIVRAHGLPSVGTADGSPSRDCWERVRCNLSCGDNGVGSCVAFSCSGVSCTITSNWAPSRTPSLNTSRLPVSCRSSGRSPFSSAMHSLWIRARLPNALEGHDVMSGKSEKP